MQNDDSCCDVCFMGCFHALSLTTGVCVLSDAKLAIDKQSQFLLPSSISDPASGLILCRPKSS